MQKNTCIVFIHSINEFHLSKNYATQTLCSRKDNTNLQSHFTTQLHTNQHHISWKFSAFLFGNLAH